jgi:ribosomal-protein-alanine N-acetyltransferase
MELARLHGATRLDLEVRASNAAAIRLYARAGFLEIGHRRAYYISPEDDAVLMQVKL